MKKVVFILICFLLLPLSFAYYTNEILVMNVNLSSSLDIKPLSSNYNIDYIIANLSFYPYSDDRQKVLQMDITPKTELKDTLIFRWEDIGDEEIGFEVSSIVETYNQQKKIREKISFPLLNVPKEVIPYTKPTPTIDSDNPEIIAFASEIAQGEDDMFIVVSKIGAWTKDNIQYDLSTLTAEVSQKASWVLKSEYGVCDELTNLFIALSRSLGIPARFISGIAYAGTASKVVWGLHGWAEVYFPGYGWVPFDVTYGQLGFLDPTHVKFKEGFDPDEPSTQYQWLGSNVDLRTHKLTVNSYVKESIGRVNPVSSVEVKPWYDPVGFGSHNLLEIKVKNLEDYYISTELFVSRPEEVVLVGEESKIITLRPKDEIILYWPLKVSNNLDSNYEYTFPIEISTTKNASFISYFSSSFDSRHYSFEKISDIMKEKEEEIKKTYSKNVDILCDIEKTQFYEYEMPFLNCFIQNTGNVYLKNIEVCVFRECDTFDLGISQKNEFNFTVKAEEIGKQDIAVIVRNSQIAKTEYIPVEVLDEPKIEITTLEYPDSVSYNHKYSLSFLLSKESDSYPVNVTVTLDNEEIQNEWYIDQLTNDKRFIINLVGKDLNVGDNFFKISCSYIDNNGRIYKSDKSINIKLTNVKFTQKIAIWLRNLGQNIMGPFSK